MHASKAAAQHDTPLITNPTPTCCSPPHRQTEAGNAMDMTEASAGEEEEEAAALQADLRAMMAGAGPQQGQQGQGQHDDGEDGRGDGEAAGGRGCGGAAGPIDEEWARRVRCPCC